MQRSRSSAVPHSPAFATFAALGALRALGFGRCRPRRRRVAGSASLRQSAGYDRLPCAARCAGQVRKLGPEYGPSNSSDLGHKWPDPAALRCSAPQWRCARHPPAPWTATLVDCIGRNRQPVSTFADVQAADVPKPARGSRASARSGAAEQRSRSRSARLRAKPALFEAPYSGPSLRVCLNTVQIKSSLAQFCSVATLMDGTDGENPQGTARDS